MSAYFCFGPGISYLHALLADIISLLLIIVYYHYFCHAALEESITVQHKRYISESSQGGDAEKIVSVSDNIQAISEPIPPNRLSADEEQKSEIAQIAMSKKQQNNSSKNTMQLPSIQKLIKFTTQLGGFVNMMQQMIFLYWHILILIIILVFAARSQGLISIGNF